MTSNVAPSEWTEHEAPLPGGGSVWSRSRQEQLPGGLWWIEQEARFRGRQVGPYPMGAGWMIECIELRRGSMTFEHDGRPIAAPSPRFVFLLPAFSLTSIDFRDPEFRFVAMAAREGPPPIAAPNVAHVSKIFPLAGSLPQTPDDFMRCLQALGEGITIEITSLPRPVQQAKRRIEREYRSRVSIAALAREIGVSHPHLTREFTRLIGMSPLKYVHYLRSTEAVGRLAAGEGILETSLDLGYADLSHFYEQFRRLGCASPGWYRAAAAREPRSASKTDKTAPRRRA